MALHVLATFIARPETAGEVHALLATLVEPIRSDIGCTRCHLVTNTADMTEMVFVEEWLGSAELDRHLAEPFVAAVVDQVNPLLARPLVLSRYVVPD